MAEFDVQEAQQRIEELMDRAADGDEILIREGCELFRLEPIRGICQAD